MINMPRPYPIVPDTLIAHRGASAYAPENTLVALELAAACGVGWVEIDVKLTRDGQLVVIHDDLLDRTTNGRGAVVLQNYAEIRSLDAGTWFSARYAGVQVPSLAEVVHCVRRLNLGLQVELKPTLGDDEETAAAVIPLLRQLWPDDDPRLFVSSFSVRSLRMARRLWPEVSLAIATLVAPADPARLLAEYECQILHVFDTMLDESHLRRLKASGVEFAVAVINDPKRACHLLESGAQTVLTDYPDLLGIRGRINAANH